LRSAIALAPLGDPREAALLADAASSARNVGARGVEWRARVLSARLALRAGFGLDALERAHSTVDRAIEAFDEVGDEQGLSWALSLRGAVYLRWGNLARCAQAAERAAEHAGNAGLVGEELEGLRDLAWATLNGPLPVADAIARCESIRERVGDASPARQDVDGVLAVLQARAGHRDEARRLASGALSSLEDLGLEEETALCRYRGGVVDALAGELEAAERAFRAVLELEPGSGRDGVRARAAASRAHVVATRGMAEEALELAALSEREAAPEDFPTQVGWRTARAKALALLGRFAEAESAARIAVRLAEQTDASSTRGEALLDLAQVRALTGRGNEAVSLANRALRGFDRRGAQAQAAVARGLLERYGAGGSAAEPAGSAAEAAPIPNDPVELPEAPAEPASGIWLTPS
jgi:tetratricopeptide (TPR) repeat protein